MAFIIQKYSLYLFFIFSAVGYYLLGYEINREQFLSLLLICIVLFFCYIGLYKLSGNNYKALLIISLLFHCIFLFNIPNLSNDYIRFIWDGRLINHGVNPFNHLPSYYVVDDLQRLGLGRKLFSQLNSPNYFTIYPPVCQAVFSFATWLSPNNILGSVFIMKAFILLAEIGTIYFIIRILKIWQLPAKKVFLYALNPLVIIETMGNIHFEAIMIFFMIFSIWLLINDQYWISAIFFGLSVCTKLIPLMFLPLLFQHLRYKKWFQYCSIVCLVTILCFLPFINNTMTNNLFSSVALYFKKFEFNASIYYIIRWIGFQVKGYNIINIAGISLSIITLLSIFVLSLKKKISVLQLPHNMLYALSIYLLLATTVHPWYIIPLIALSIFTRFKFVIVWSAMIMLSYYIYSNALHEENMWLIAIEYLIVGGWMIYEFRVLKSNSYSY